VKAFGNPSEHFPLIVASPNAIWRDIAQSGMAMKILDAIAFVRDKVPVSDCIMVLQIPGPCQVASWERHKRDSASQVTGIGLHLTDLRHD
jgi:hypothetical protein